MRQVDMDRQQEAAVMPAPSGTHAASGPHRPIGNQALGRLLGPDSAHADPAARRDTAAAILASPGKGAELDRFDPFMIWLREQSRRAAGRPAPPSPPELVIPGDTAQQYDLSRVSGWELLDRPDVQRRLESLAEGVEAHEKATPPGTVVHSKTAMLNYWSDRFAASVEYILTVRTNQLDPATRQFVSAQALIRRELAREEAKLAKTVQGDELVTQVTALRESFRERWARRVEQAALRFVDLAENEAKLLTAGHRPAPAAVLGLPKGLEKEVTRAQAPDQLEEDAKPVSASVVKFMKAVQQESGLKAVAGNYKDHEKWSPHVSDTSIGKFSFDVSPPISVDAATGFYDRAPLLKFLEAVERAGQKTDIEWMAFYNDAAVIKQFNDTVSKGRIAFSGGGGGGTYHHGPQPYILHLHFNIMPNDLKARFLIGAALAKAEKALHDYLNRVGALF